MESTVDIWQIRDFRYNIYDIFYLIIKLNIMKWWEILNKSDTTNIWSIEDIQDNISAKLARMFSFYNEQEFYDEIHWVKPVELEVSVE